VLGNGAIERGVIRGFADQLRAYSWCRRGASVRGRRDPRLGRILYASFNEHLREKAYTLHHPPLPLQGLSSEDREALLRKVFVPAVQRRLASLVRGLLLGMEPDHLLLVHRIREMSKDQSQGESHSDVAVSDIVDASSGFPRSDGQQISATWAARIIREQLAVRRVIIGERLVPLLEEGARRGSSKTFHFSLDKLPEEVAEYYGVPVSLAQLTEVFLRNFLNPKTLRR
jgi:hypothetical protein